MSSRWTCHILGTPGQAWHRENSENGIYYPISLLIINYYLEKFGPKSSVWASQFTVLQKFTIYGFTISGGLLYNSDPHKNSHVSPHFLHAFQHVLELCSKLETGNCSTGYNEWGLRDALLMWLTPIASESEILSTNWRVHISRVCVLCRRAGPYLWPCRLSRLHRFARASVGYRGSVG